MRNLVALVSSAALVAAIPLPQLTASVEAKTADEVCMTKRTKGRQSGDKDINVIVKKQKTATMKARGFKAIACKGDAAKHASYKKEMCKFARIAPADVQAQFKKQHGATPNEFCQASK
ncbi:MAG: hypothetical protein AB8B54_05620 [Sphingorhabdus sp.]